MGMNQLMTSTTTPISPATSKWHYSRIDLAKAYISQINSGINSIAIFAERRKG
ncbi:MAG: hypothetical protein ACI8WB_001970, partial [Phenylobacterium sp.]